MGKQVQACGPGSLHILQNHQNSNSVALTAGGKASALTGAQRLVGYSQETSEAVLQPWVGTEVQGGEQGAEGH